MNLPFDEWIVQQRWYAGATASCRPRARGRRLAAG